MSAKAVDITRYITKKKGSRRMRIKH